MHLRRLFKLTELGWGIALPVLFLATVGLLAIHATDKTQELQTSELISDTPTTPADVNWFERLTDAVGPTTLKQGLFLLTGAVIMFAMVQTSYQRMGRYAYVFYGVILVLLVLLVLDRYVNLPFVPVKKSTRRWIEMGGLSIQPSEFMKPVLVLTLARYLRFGSSYRTLKGLAWPFLLTLVPMALILKQPDLGTLLMLLPLLFAMLYVAGAKLWHLGMIVFAGCAVLPLFYFWGMKPYQRERIHVVFKQNTADERWQMNQGYQLRQSKVALGTGGVFGEGYQQGMFMQHALLPEKENDFIFAIVGHQWGLVGCTLVIVAYGLIVLFGLEVATSTNDPFGKLLSVGVIAMIVVQALLNMCMNIGLAPITGMPLPFVSAGGSSLWANFIGLGFLLNVAKRHPMLIANPPFQHKRVES